MYTIYLYGRDSHFFTLALGSKGLFFPYFFVNRCESLIHRRLPSVYTLLVATPAMDFCWPSFLWQVVTTFLDNPTNSCLLLANFDIFFLKCAFCSISLVSPINVQRPVTQHTVAQPDSNLSQSPLAHGSSLGYDLLEFLGFHER